jgi:diguanylate cyclase (GGDEF)-like protein
VRAFWNILPSSKPHATWAPPRYIWLSVLAGGVGLALSILAWSAVWNREEQLTKLELGTRANTYALTLQFGIASFTRKVAGLRALFDSTTNVSRAEFEEITKYFLKDQIAILGMSWIPRVTRDQRDFHERAGVRDGLPGYRIKSVASDGSLAPSPEHSEYFPVFYTATEARDSPVYGLDLNDGGVRQQTLERARDSDRMATSPNFALQAGTGDRNGFFIMLPVYRPGLPHETVQDRNDNLVGFVQGVFQTSVLIETILKTTTAAPAGLDLYFFPANSSRDSSTPLYFHSSRARKVPIGPQPRAAVTAGPHWSDALSIGDATWTFIAVPIPGGPGTSGHHVAYGVLIGGLLVSAMLAAYIWAAARHAQRMQTANERLLAQNLRTDAAINNMVQGFIMFDAAEQIVVCNERFIDMYGLSREIVKPGCSLLELLRHRVTTGHLKLDPDQYRADLLAQLETGKIVHWVVGAADGREISIMNKPMPGGGWIVTHEDITERHQAEAKIAHMALHDGLTDLPNRHLLDEQIDDHFARLLSGQKFAVLCLDLDHFKHVNDTLGHPFGDKLLEQVAARLRGCVRLSDTVARLGGDEFAILQGSLTELAETESLAARIVDTIGAPFDLDGHQVVIGVSVGIAVAPTDATDTMQLHRAADLALYRAKTDGRGAYRFFEPAMDQRVLARRALELDLHKALANEEFVLHYQPIVNLATERISGFEALIRWNHPERGMLPPADFIPFAEETTKIAPIGEWVLRTACEEAAKWPSHVSVAVNVSPVQFRTSNLYEVVTAELSRSGLAADRLELEITESALLWNEESAVETLRRLRALGVRIAMDDCGTGHSSLIYLRRFPFDKIKIDRSFIQDLLNKKDARAIVRALVKLAASLELGTTAEGVETLGQCNYLKRVGCLSAQGYFFSEARPAKDVYDMLALRDEQSAVVA